MKETSTHTKGKQYRTKAIITERRQPVQNEGNQYRLWVTGTDRIQLSEKKKHCKLVLYGVHRTCAETAAVLRGTSNVTIKRLCNHLGGYCN